MATALAIDLLLGEPPAPVHSTVWMGRWIAAGRRFHWGRSPGSSLLAGATLVAGGAIVSMRAARVAERVLGRAPESIRAPLRGTLLKPALALRALLSAGAQIERALAGGDLPEARRLLAWHLVSRDTSGLSPAEVAGAAIESLAENLGDGLVAPLLAFRAGGLPAAYGHRFVNTADAMLGYRTPELEWFGKFAARADDALNWIPARLSALCIALAAPLGDGRPDAALWVALRDAGRTPSPNAGWPMAAMAGALGVRLDKRGAYTLHPEGCDPGAPDLRRALRIVGGAGLLAAGALRR